MESRSISALLLYPLVFLCRRRSRERVPIVPVYLPAFAQHMPAAKQTTTASAARRSTGNSQR